MREWLDPLEYFHAFARGVLDSSEVHFVFQSPKMRPGGQQSLDYPAIVYRQSGQLGIETIDEGTVVTDIYVDIQVRSEDAITTNDLANRLQETLGRESRVSELVAADNDYDHDLKIYSKTINVKIEA